VKYKKLSVIFCCEKSEIWKVNFIWDSVREIKENICCLADSQENLLSLCRVWVLSRYSFQNYKTEKKDSIEEGLVWKKQQAAYKELQDELENIILARDLWETPACDMTPEIFATTVKKTKFNTIKVKVLSFKDIQKKWLGLIEWVWKWSENKPCMVILEHIVDKNKPIQWIVWKGVTFDTWWNQLKPEWYMYEMKGDMGGAAVTFALMKELDRKKVKKNIRLRVWWQ